MGDAEAEAKPQRIENRNSAVLVRYHMHGGLCQAKKTTILVGKGADKGEEAIDRKNRVFQVMGHGL
jgi:hypothetical protein